MPSVRLRRRTRFPSVHASFEFSHSQGQIQNKTDATIRVSGRSLVTLKPAVIGGGGYEGWSPQSVQQWWPCACCSTNLVTLLCSHLHEVCSRDQDRYDCPHGVTCARDGGSARTEPIVSRSQLVCRQNARGNLRRGVVKRLPIRVEPFSKHLERRLELRGNPHCG